MVLGQGYRNPALVAKMVATLQVLSSGRFVLGIGAGWQQDEYIACHFPCPSAGHPDRAAWRGDRPDEVVEGVSPGGQPVRVYVLPGTTIPPTPASQDTSARLLGRSHGAPRAESGALLVPGSGRVTGFHPFSPRRDHGRLRVSQLSLTDRAAFTVGPGVVSRSLWRLTSASILHGCQRRPWRSQRVVRESGSGSPTERHWHRA